MILRPQIQKGKDLLAWESCFTLIGMQKQYAERTHSLCNYTNVHTQTCIENILQFLQLLLLYIFSVFRVHNYLGDKILLQMSEHFLHNSKVRLKHMRIVIFHMAQLLLHLFLFFLSFSFCFICLAANAICPDVPYR